MKNQFLLKADLQKTLKTLFQENTSLRMTIANKIQTTKNLKETEKIVIIVITNKQQSGLKHRGLNRIINKQIFSLKSSYRKKGSPGTHSS